MNGSEFSQPPWWMLLDRDIEKAAARKRLGETGGLIVVRGDDDAGRHETARAMSRTLVSKGASIAFGRETAASSSVAAVGLRAALRAAWSDLENATGGLSGALLFSAEPVERLSREFRRRLEEIDGPVAVFLEEIDREAPLDPSSVAALHELAPVGKLVVVTSRRESRTNWHVSAPPALVLELESFRKADLVSFLRSWLAQTAMTPDDRQEVLSLAQRLMAAGRATIRPKRAYEILGLVDALYVAAQKGMP